MQTEQERQVSVLLGDGTLGVLELGDIAVEQRILIPLVAGSPLDVQCRNVDHDALEVGRVQTLRKRKLRHAVSLFLLNQGHVHGGMRSFRAASS